MKVLKIDAHDAKLVQEVKCLRVDAYRAELNGSSYPFHEWDVHDEHATHWAVLDEDRRVIACARFCVHESVASLPDAAFYEALGSSIVRAPVGSFNRLAVAPDSRGRGLSRALIASRVREAQSRGCRTIVATVRAPRVAIYEAAGFRDVSTVPAEIAATVLPEWKDRATPRHVMVMDLAIV